MCGSGDAAHVSNKWIHRVIVKQTTAEAMVTLSGVVQTVKAVGLADLRRQLYALGFSKRAIATACKNARQEDT
jgi:hypothetical protein